MKPGIERMDIARSGNLLAMKAALPVLLASFLMQLSRAKGDDFAFILVACFCVTVPML